MTNINVLTHPSLEAVTARVYRGQTIGFSVDGTEYIHAGAHPSTEEAHKRLENGAWRGSDLVCFPIFGPAENLPEGWELNQHGMWRAVNNELSGITGSSADFKQSYDAGTKIAVPGKPSMSLPFSYSLDKRVALTGSEKPALQTSLVVSNTGTTSFPYDLGLHPAFITDDYEQVRIAGRELSDLATPHTMLDNDEYIDVQNPGRNARLYSNFKKVIVWSPNAKSGMFCVEPVTGISKDGLAKIIEPGETHKYASLLVPYSNSE